MTHNLRPETQLKFEKMSKILLYTAVGLHMLSVKTKHGQQALLCSFFSSSRRTCAFSPTKRTPTFLFTLILALTVIFAWISYFFPFLPINRQLSSSTLADTIWKRSWFLGNIDSNVRISCLSVFRQAIGPLWNNLESLGTRTAGKSHKTLAMSYDVHSL